VLSASWIPVGHRLFGSTFITRGEVDPQKTVLWWGDNRDKQIVAEAKCYKAEPACTQDKTSGAPSFVRVLSEDLARTLTAKKDFSVSSYQEFFVPADTKNPTVNLYKFGLRVLSVLKAGQLAYSLEMSASSQVRELKREQRAQVFRLSGGDSAVGRALLLERQDFSVEKVVKASQMPPGKLFPLAPEIRSEPRNVSARVMEINVHHPSGSIVATLPIVFIESK
jgi:hypothetical protein